MFLLSQKDLSKPPEAYESGKATDKNLSLNKFVHRSEKRTNLPGCGFITFECTMSSNFNGGNDKKGHFLLFAMGGVMKFSKGLATMALAMAVLPTAAQQEQIPTSIASSVAQPFEIVQRDFLAVAEAMPETKYSFAPTDGNFKGIRTFAEQVKHVA